MAQITKVVRGLLEANERRVLSQSLSDCVRQLDHADRRAAADKDTTPYLAAAILQLDAVAKGIKEWRPRHAEPVDPFLISEHAALQKDVDEMIRKYLTRIGDPSFVRLGATGWARRVIKRLAQEKAEAEQRRIARAAARPTTKHTGKCVRCHAPRVLLNASTERCDACDAEVAAATAARPRRPVGKAAPKPMVKIASRRVVAGFKFDPASGRTVKYTPEQQLEIDAAVDRMNRAR